MYIYVKMHVLLCIHLVEITGMDMSIVSKRRYRWRHAVYSSSLRATVGFVSEEL